MLYPQAKYEKQHGRRKICLLKIFI